MSNTDDLARTPKDAVMLVIRDDEGRFLLVRRGPSVRSPGFWCPVSGKVEAGETQAAAVEREAKEEVGLRLEAVRKLHESMTDCGTYRLHWWTTRLVASARSEDAHVASTEIDRLIWCGPDELRALTPVFEDDVRTLESLSITSL